MVRLVFAFSVLLLAPQDPPLPPKKEAQEFVEKNVNAAIDKGLASLREKQLQFGEFKERTGVAHGETALALYTFLACGVPLEDPSATKALDWLFDHPYSWSNTYEVSLIALAFSEALPQMKRRTAQAKAIITKAVNWLVEAQLDRGGWGYTQKSPSHDHSNTQFAIMGLRAAINAGVHVPRQTWYRELDHLKSAQLKDGGWPYRCTDPPDFPSLSMTAAGVMGRYMARASLGADAKELATDPDLKRGLAALNSFWGVLKPAWSRKDFVWVYYTLWSVERACMVTDTRLLGAADWYVEGAWFLIHRQQVGGLGLADQCFTLLFLKRAFVPVKTPSKAPPIPAAKPQPTAPTPTPSRGRTPSGQEGSQDESNEPDADEGKPREME